MAGKLLMQIFLLIFVVRPATLWEWALTFCCRIQALIACMMCILYSLNQNYPSHQTRKSFIASIVLFRSRIHSMRGQFEGLITVIARSHGTCSTDLSLMARGTDSYVNGLHVGKQDHLTITYNKTGG